MANEQLRSMLNNLINEKSTEVTIDFHQYLIEKVKSIMAEKLDESVANEPNLLKQIAQYLETEGFMATYEVRSVRKNKAILGLSEKGADSEAILTLSGNDLKMKLTGINDNEEKQERRFKLKISGKSAKQIGQQLEDEIDSWFHHEMQ